MPAKLIIVTNQKGGAGKTTAAVHLAGTAVRRGYKTLLIDADKQGTATKWVAQAEDGQPHKIRVMGLAMAEAKIAQEVKQYVEDYDIIIVDCPPSVDSPIPQVMLMIADLAIVPIVPKPGDLWASTDLLELADRATTMNPELKVRLLGSNVIANLAMSKHSLNSMATMRDSAPLFKTRLHQRTAYVEAMLTGDSVHYFGGSAKTAVNEIESLFDEVASTLKLQGAKARGKK
ncbi:MAG: ParA family partition ATPase [Noviherbaspirillum sp.]